MIFRLYLSKDITIDTEKNNREKLPVYIKESVTIKEEILGIRRRRK
jgi:hypothetical protein